MLLFTESLYSMFRHLITKSKFKFWAFKFFSIFSGFTITYLPVTNSLSTLTVYFYLYQLTCWLTTLFLIKPVVFLSVRYWCNMCVHKSNSLDASEWAKTTAYAIWLQFLLQYIFYVSFVSWDMFLTFSTYSDKEQNISFTIWYNLLKCRKLLFQNIGSLYFSAITKWE